MKIRGAAKKDWPLIKSLIRKYPDRLEQLRLPEWHEFVVIKFFFLVFACCALKIYGKKLAEIRSLAFLFSRLRKRYAKPMVKECISRARKEGVYQVFVTVGKTDKELFLALGFEPFNNQKFAFLKVIKRLKLHALQEIPGILVRPATEDDYKGIKNLVKKHPDTLIQPDSVLFPDWKDFFVAIDIATGDVVGCCALVIFRREGDGVKSDPELAEVRGFVVDPACEGRGIGHQLVCMCENRAIQERVYELMAVTDRGRWFKKHFNFSIQRGAEEVLFLVLGNGR